MAKASILFGTFPSTINLTSFAHLLYCCWINLHPVSNSMNRTWRWQNTDKCDARPCCQWAVLLVGIIRWGGRIKNSFIHSHFW